MTGPDTRRSRRAAENAQLVNLPPGRNMLQALGGGHSLGSAVADIIDNSIDAQADTVQIRFLVEDDYLKGIRIRDNGIGMDKETLINALRLGNRRDYAPSDLGHFGIGLKSASMRFAETLSVYTATVNEKTETTIAGMELSPHNNVQGIQGIQGKVLSNKSAEDGYRFGEGLLPLGAGTVVEWAGIKHASGSTDPKERAQWLEQTIEELREHLGLIFQRLLQNGKLRIDIDMFDLAHERAGTVRSVKPVAPFGYKIPGSKGFPMLLSAEGPGGTEVHAKCHILPPGGKDNLPGPKKDWQGLYIYRNNRLLTPRAGWHGLTQKNLTLARVEIDLTDDLLPYATPTPEKNDVTLKPEYIEALQRAVDEQTGTRFAEYLDKAQSVFKESNTRSSEKPITPLNAGLPASIIEGLSESLGWRPDKDPVSIVWAELPENDLFKVDLHLRTLNINARYREIFGGEDTASSYLFTVLLYLLTEEHFTRDSHLRASTLERLERIDSLLLTAIQAADHGDDTAQANSFKGTPPDALAGLLKASGFQQGNDSTVQGPTNLSAHPASEQAVGLAREDEKTEQERNEDQEAHIPSNRQPLEGPVGRAVRDLGLPDSPLSDLDYEVFKRYCSGDSISEIAGMCDLTDREVVTRLVLTLFGPETLNDDQEVAPYHGMPYSPDERERLLSIYQHEENPYGAIPSIARRMGRTPFAVAWRLLDSPRRPVPINKRVKRHVSRRVKSE